MNEVLRKINSLKDIPRAKKIALLREYIRHDETFKNVIIYATSDTIQFGITRLPIIRHNDLRNKKYEKIINEIFCQLEYLSKNESTLQEKQYLAKLADKIENGRNIINRILQKNLKCGVSSRTVNKAFPGLIDCIPDKKCFSESCVSRISFPAYCEEDCNGIIMNALVENGNIRYISRKGHTYNIKNETLKKEIISISNGFDIALVGICTSKNNNHFSDLNKILKNKANKKVHDSIIFIVSEIMPLSDFQKFECCVDLKSRYESSFFYNLSCNSGHLRIPNRKIVNSYQEAIEMSKEVINNGGNGVIVKDFKSFWREVDIGSWALIRKPVECILEIVFYDQKNKLLYCKSIDSFIKSIIANGLENINENILLNNVGKCCKVQFAEIISKPGKVSKSLFNPMFIEFSDKKANTLEEIKIAEIKAKKRKKYE